MTDFKNAIRERAAALRIDLLGFTAKERFAGLAPDVNPFSIFPDGQTVILLGRRIPRGALRGAVEGTDFAAYGNFGYKMLDDQFAASSAYDLVRFIEDAGWEACPIFPNPDVIRNMGVPVAPDRPAPNVAPDFDYAAVACGLGSMGLNGEFLSLELGPRQRFQMIITDAPLPSDPLLVEDVCLRCGACIAACPMGAMDAGRTRLTCVAGLDFEVADIDYDLCRVCTNGGTQNRLHPKGRPDRLAAACTRACVHALAQAGVGRMRSDFTPQTPWARDRKGQRI